MKIPQKMITRIKNIFQKTLPSSRVNRFFFVLLVISFFIGFFYNSKNHSDKFYLSLIETNSLIEELRSNKCNDLNNYEFSKRLEAGDIEFHIDVTKNRPECLNFISALESSRYHSFPLTEELINEEFDKKFKNFILKNNSIWGLFFFGITLLALLLINLTQRIIRWIMSGV